LILVVVLGLLALPAEPAHAESAAERRIVTLTIVNGGVPSVGETLRVKQGDSLELRWASDKPMELHLHGYDIQAKVVPGALAVMTFTATIPGRFPIEAHGQGPGSHRPVIYLEVYP
jgi:FtsP/CotA-like multicopper oxidase with cupredoxin domain